jgi:hypothetical protein
MGVNMGVTEVAGHLMNLMKIRHQQNPVLSRVIVH